MASDSQDMPPAYDELEARPSSITSSPETLILSGGAVVSENAPETPLYRTSWDITSIPQKGSSVVFEQITQTSPEKADGEALPTQQSRQLFYLVHPVDAGYNKDAPTYYMTSAENGALGNIELEVTKPKLQKPEFMARLSPGKTAKDKILFDDSPKVIFDAKSKLLGGKYSWTDSSGRHLAREESKGGKHQLVITETMDQATRDMLVAVWCLRLWHDTAESKEAKREAMDRYATVEGLQGYENMSMAKRTGALGSLAGAGA